MPVNFDTKNSISYGAKPIKVSNKKIVNGVCWLGENCTSAKQKLITGGTGLIIQPIIDINNKEVDEKTRKTSCAKTISRAIIGTATGVAIRELCIKGLASFTKTKAIVKEEMKKAAKKRGETIKPLNKDINLKSWQQCLLPNSMKNSRDISAIKKYRGALGTFAALGIMLFTNFLIDAPVTSWLTNNVFSPLLNKEKGGNK
jgi:hypothetical protein